MNLMMCEIDNERFALLRECEQSQLGDIVWRIEHDYYQLNRLEVLSGEVILDIGAHFGLVAMVLSRRFPRSTVIAIEPDADMYRLLIHHIQINSISNIRPLHGLISAGKWGEWQTFLADRNNTLRRAITPSFFRKSDEIEVRGAPVLSTEDIARTVAGRPVGLAKINAFGEEDAALTLIHDLGGARSIVGEAAHESAQRAISRMSANCADRYYWRFSDAFDVKARGTRSEGPSLSIVVPVYNVEKYLVQCVDSLVAQDIEDVEVIAVDDGSTDSSPSILADYANRFPFLRVVTKPNGGCASARQAGLEAANGRYVTFIDSDDWVTADAYQAMLAATDERPYDIVQGGFTRFYEIENRFDPADESWLDGVADAAGGVVDRDRLMVLQPTIWRRIYRRQFLLDNNIKFPTSIRRYDDMVFQFHTLMLMNSFKLVQEGSYFYRQQREGQDIMADDDRLYIHFEIFDTIEEVIVSSRRREFWPIFFQVMLNTHHWALGKIRAEFRDEYERQARSQFSRMAAQHTAPDWLNRVPHHEREKRTLAKLLLAPPAAMDKEVAVAL